MAAAVARPPRAGSPQHQSAGQQELASDPSWHATGGSERTAQPPAPIHGQHAQSSVAAVWSPAESLPVSKVHEDDNRCANGGMSGACSGAGSSAQPAAALPSSRAAAEPHQQRGFQLASPSASPRQAASKWDVQGWSTVALLPRRRRVRLSPAATWHKLCWQVGLVAGTEEKGNEDLEKEGKDWPQTVAAGSWAEVNFVKRRGGNVIFFFNPHM